MNEVFFDGMASFSDWGLYLTSLTIDAPKPKDIYVEIPNGDGALDLTEALTAQGADALADHPQIRAELAAYLEKFGDRCTEELKLESIPLAQDPAPLLAAIAASAATRPGRSYAASRLDPRCIPRPPPRPRGRPRRPRRGPPRGLPRTDRKSVV